MRYAGEAGFACGEGVGGGVGRERSSGSVSGEAGGFVMRARGPESDEGPEGAEGFGRTLSLAKSFAARASINALHRPWRGRT